MHNRLIFFTIVLIILGLFTGISEAKSSNNVVYIYSSDTSSANSYKSLLDSNGLSTSLIYRDDVASSNFSKYSLIIIGSDLDITDSQDDASIASVIDNSGKPILALGEGGYSFFGQLKLKTGSPNGWHGSENSIFVMNASKKIFNQPYAITIPENNIIQLYTSTDHVGIYLLSVPSNVIPLGRESGDSDHYPLTVEKNKYVLWGFTGSPDTMTEDGKHLFVNIASSMAKPSTGTNKPDEPKINYKYLDITSTPNAADIYIDGVYAGQTPKYDIKMELRTYSILLEHEGYYSWERNVDKDQNNIAATLTKIKPLEPGERETSMHKAQPYGFLVIFSTPPNADAYINGRLLTKQTPLKFKYRDTRTYSIRLEKTGYKSWSKNVKINQYYPDKKPYHGINAYLEKK